jgi:hypothetical protein
MSKRYETPELVELGPAAEMTLGAKGCTDDGQDCKLERENQIPAY